MDKGPPTLPLCLLLSIHYFSPFERGIAYRGGKGPKIQKKYQMKKRIDDEVCLEAVKKDASDIQANFSQVLDRNRSVGLAHNPDEKRHNEK